MGENVATLVLGSKQKLKHKKQNGLREWDETKHTLISVGE
jgi:hypothetical protein